MRNLSQLTKKHYIIGGLLLLAIVGLPVLTLVSQQPQETRSRASASTTLEVTPGSSETAPIEKTAGDPVLLDVYIDPGNNLPSIVKLDITYDPAKFQPDDVPFVVNTAAFPSKLEGPIIADGHILLSVSIGSDSTKAIQTRTKVGTIQLAAIGETTAPAIVGFGDRSQVLSVSPGDESNQNVLSTTIPAYVTVVGYVSPTPSIVPTAYDPGTSIMPSPSPTTDPYASPSVVPTTIEYTTPTVSPLTTLLSFNVFIHGIGLSGDNVNPTSTLSNKNPRHPQRTIEVQVFDNMNDLVKTANGAITYSSASGSFIGTVDIGPSFVQGIYTVKVKESTHLRRLLPGILTIIPKTENQIPDIALVAGDINNDNSINVADYNILIGCYSDLLPAISCTDSTKITSDLNDDGAVNQLDYNLFLREISIQTGN